jgi:tripartite-type tricarboxylate transporter receptor subunit TctC
MTIFATPLLAQDWQPNRPINVIVPYGAGGGVDTYARSVAVGLQDRLGVPIVIVNKPGSGGLVGAAEAAAAKPDGYTLLVATSGGLLLGSMFKDAPVDPLESFETISQIGNLVFGIAVPKDSSFQTIDDLVAAAKENPGKLRWGHAGRGAAVHVPGQAFLDRNDLTATDVPFKGGAKIRAAIIGAHVDYGILGIQQSFGFENELRMLGVFSSERYGLAPDVPTFDEQGVDTGNIGSPVTAFAPLGTPAEVIATIDAALAEIARAPAFAEAMAPKGLVPVYATGTDADTALLAIKDGAQPIIDALKAGN